MGLPYTTFELDSDGQDGWVIFGCGSDGLRAKIFRTSDPEEAQTMLRSLRSATSLHGDLEKLRQLVYEIRRQPVTDPSIEDDPGLLADVNKIIRNLEGTMPGPPAKTEE